MQLGICIIRCQHGPKDYVATVDSVKNLPVKYKIYRLNSYYSLQKHITETKDDWTLVLYEREALDSRFNESIGIMLAEETICAYKFCCTVKTKRTPVIIEQYRLFKQGSHLDSNSFSLADPDCTTIKILDGWIYEHGTEQDICGIGRGDTVH